MSEVACCPDCEHHAIQTRPGAPRSERNRCRRCGHTFARPARRPSERSDAVQFCNSGLAAQLAAEDVTELEDIADAIGG